MLQRPVDLSGGWDALVGPGPWKAGPGGRWPRMRPAPSMPCSRTPAPRPAAVVTTTQSFLRHPKRSLGVGPCRAAPPLLTLSSQSCRHRFERGKIPTLLLPSGLLAQAKETWQILAMFPWAWVPGNWVWRISGVQVGFKPVGYSLYWTLVERWPLRVWKLLVTWKRLN